VTLDALVSPNPQHAVADLAAQAAPVVLHPHFGHFTLNDVDNYVCDFHRDGLTSVVT
jgi:hypothetical protein